MACAKIKSGSGSEWVSEPVSAMVTYWAVHRLSSGQLKNESHPTLLEARLHVTDLCNLVAVFSHRHDAVARCFGPSGRHGVRWGLVSTTSKVKPSSGRTFPEHLGHLQNILGTYLEYVFSSVGRSWHWPRSWKSPVICATMLSNTAPHFAPKYAPPPLLLSCLRILTSKIHG